MGIKVKETIHANGIDISVYTSDLECLNNPVFKRSDFDTFKNNPWPSFRFPTHFDKVE